MVEGGDQQLLIRLQAGGDGSNNIVLNRSAKCISPLIKSSQSAV